MPQFDPHVISPQVFWLAITFVVLYALLATLVIPRIGAVLDDRQLRIDTDLNAAAQLKAEAEAAVAAYEKALADSRAHASKVIKEAGDLLATQSEQRHKELAAQLHAQIQAGEQKIVAAKEAALTHVRDVAAEVAAAAVVRLTGVAPDGNAVQSAIAAVLEKR